MNARKVAALFAAYTWYEEVHASRTAPETASRFARAHWRAFVSAAPVGLGRLLRRVSKRPGAGAGRRPLGEGASSGVR